MKNRIHLTMICSILALFIALPSFALSQEEAYAYLKGVMAGEIDPKETPLPPVVVQVDPEEKADLYTKLKGTEGCTAHAAPQISNIEPFSPYSKAQQHCPHENDRIFYYSDTDTAIRLCVSCGFNEDILPSSMNEVTAFVYTSAISVTPEHTHTYGDWSFYSPEKHRQVCSGCGDYKYDYHDRIPATCTTDEKCTDCGGTYYLWDLKMGHQMGHYCPDPIFTTTHDYRCMRTDNDGVFVCDYIEQTVNCSFDTIIEPAVNGVHDLWGWCRICNNVSEMTDVSCDLLEAYSCAWCNMID